MSTAPKATAKPAATTPAGTTSATGTNTTTGTTTVTPLNKLIETPEFAWFSAHAFALVTYILGFLFRKGGFSTFLSKAFFLSEFLSFGLILFQKYGTKVVPRQLAVDDNAHYLGLSLLWLLVSKRALAATPFAIYSIFHALTYARAYLLPALGHSKDSPISKQIEQFIKTRNNQFTLIAAQIELGLLVFLFFSFFTFRKANFLVFALYAVFFRFRYAVSQYTRQAVHSLELQVDNLTHSGPPAVKDSWLKFKSLLAQIPGPSKVN